MNELKHQHLPLEAEVNDRRVRRTRQALHQALIELMIEQDFHEITVQDLIDRADVGRSTFYAHFDDKTELLRSSLSGLQAILTSAVSGGTGDARRPLRFSLEMINHVSDQRPLLQALLGPRRAETVHREMSAVLQEVVTAELLTLSPDAHRRRVPLELVARSVVATFMATMIWWVDQDFQPGPAEVDTAFQRLAYPGVRSALGLGATQPAPISEPPPR